MENHLMYEELIELLTTDSASGKEGLIADKLSAKLQEIGFQVIRDRAHEAFGGECGNVIGIREGELPGAVLLCSHMDRVPNGYGIKPVEKDGILYSDGTTILAADDISGVCAILDGVRRAISSGKPLPRLEVVFTVGEETALWGFKNFDMSQLQAKIGYFFDSPGRTGRFVNGAPGLYRLAAELKGKPAHAGNEPEKGIDAAKAMSEIIATMNIGRLDHQTTSNFPILRTGSTARNVVCDYASFEGEARSRDLDTLLAYVEYFKKHCQEVSDKYGTELTLTCEELFLPFLIEESDPVLLCAKAACEKLGLDCRIEVGGGGMDANIVNAKGMRTVGVATGYSKNHTTNEQLILEDFFKSGLLAQTLIETYAETCESK